VPCAHTPAGIMQLRATTLGVISEKKNNPHSPCGGSWTHLTHYHYASRWVRKHVAWPGKEKRL